MEGGKFKKETEKKNKTRWHCFTLGYLFLKLTLVIPKKWLFDKLNSPCGQSGAFQLSVTQLTRLEIRDERLWAAMSVVGHALPKDTPSLLAVSLYDKSRGHNDRLHRIVCVGI